MKVQNKIFQIRYFYPLSSSTICSCRNLKLISYQSTSSVPIINENTKKEIHPEYPLLDTKFNQYQIAYRYRRNIELLRGYFVYRLFSINFLVNNQDKVNFQEK